MSNVSATERNGELRGPGVIPSSALAKAMRERPSPTKPAPRPPCTRPPR